MGNWFKDNLGAIIGTAAAPGVGSFVGHGYDKYKQNKANQANQYNNIPQLNPADIYGQQMLDRNKEDLNAARNEQRKSLEQAGSDAGSAYLMNEKANANAMANRNLAAQGVKGGVAAGAVDAINRKQAANIAASIYGQRQQAIDSLLGSAGNVAQGQAAIELANQQARMPVPQQGGLISNLWQGILG